jgi:hypothetical protein
MIIDGPITSDLTVGADTRIVQDGDAQIVVPATVLPVVLALRPTRLIPFGGGELVNDSTLVNFFLSRVNLGSATNTVIQLSKGLWELELTMATVFDYLPVPPSTGTSPVEITLTDALISTQTVVMLSRFPSIGSWVDYNRLRVLLTATHRVQVFVPITGATDDLAVQLSLNAIRIL